MSQSCSRQLVSLHSDPSHSFPSSATTNLSNVCPQTNCPHLLFASISIYVCVSCLVFVTMALLDSCSPCALSFHCASIDAALCSSTALYHCFLLFFFIGVPPHWCDWFALPLPVIGQLQVNRRREEGKQNHLKVFFLYVLHFILLWLTFTKFNCLLSVVVACKSLWCPTFSHERPTTRTRTVVSRRKWCWSCLTNKQLVSKVRLFSSLSLQRHSLASVDIITFKFILIVHRGR